MKHPPTKLSDLLELAVNDAKRCQKDKLNMDTWHTFEDPICHVCMAGAVMAKTLHMPLRAAACPEELTNDWYEPLCAIDAMRTGEFGYVAVRLNVTIDATLAQQLDNIIRDNYRDDLHRAPWKTYMRVVKMLWDEGL